MLIEPYKVSQADKERLMKELKGDERKVTAIILSVEYWGKMTGEQVATYTGVSRMTIWRWEQHDYIYAYELERLFEKQQAYIRKEVKKRIKPRKYSTADIMGDMKLLQRIVSGI